MHRYRTRARKAGSPAGPIVAFLLVACFGILFAGCSRPSLSINGPDDVTEPEDFSFTAEDVSTFRNLQQESASSAVTSAPGAAGTPSSLSMGNAAASGAFAMSTSSLPVLDLSMVQTYASLRSTSAQPQSNTYRVVNPTLKLREQPSVSAKLVATLQGGNELTVNEFTNGEWARVQLADGRKGYVSIKYIAKVTTEERLAQEKKVFDGLYFVSYQFVNVRAEANQKSAKLGEIPGKTFVRPTSIDGQWARVPFQGKEGYVSLEYLTAFSPAFIVRQERYHLPILLYRVDDPAVLQTLLQHADAVRQAGGTMITMSDFAALVLRQDKQQDVRLDPKRVIFAVTGVTGANARSVTDALYGKSIRATLLLKTKDVGISGITEKMLQTMVADNLDVQSSGHTGDDLRALTTAQVTLEVQQSRKILEDATKRQVLAFAYPEGGTNERVMEIVAKAGYLFGLGNGPDSEFTRAQFLQLPSYNVSSTMAAADVVKLLK